MLPVSEFNDRAFSFLQVNIDAVSNEKTCNFGRFVEFFEDFAYLGDAPATKASKPTALHSVAAPDKQKTAT